MDHCGVCMKEFKKEKCMGFLDTHHINHQKDCKDGFVIDKPHMTMNSRANLVPLCKNCHHDVHHNRLQIDGYIQTSNGLKLQYKYI